MQPIYFLIFFVRGSRRICPTCSLYANIIISGAIVLTHNITSNLARPSVVFLLFALVFSFDPWGRLNPSDITPVSSYQRCRAHPSHSDIPRLSANTTGTTGWWRGLETDWTRCIRHSVFAFAWPIFTRKVLSPTHRPTAIIRFISEPCKLQAKLNCSISMHKHA